jgi:hypothetical protein
MEPKASEGFAGHPSAGIVLLLVLGPLVVAGYGLAAVAIIGVLTGWSPGVLSGDTPLDFLYGGGTATMLRFFGFMAGAMVGTLSLGAIRWGFTGEFKAPGI